MPGRISGRRIDGALHGSSLKKAAIRRFILLKKVQGIVKGRNP